jgi:hypothetical protein
MVTEHGGNAVLRKMRHEASQNRYGGSVLIPSFPKCSPARKMVSTFLFRLDGEKAEKAYIVTDLSTKHNILCIMMKNTPKFCEKNR